MSDPFESYRPLLFSIAYRMLGSVMEAEDIVQEAYLRYQAVPREDIQTLKPFLTTIVHRLCLDHLKSAKAQRETYTGMWLPEPVLTGEGSSLLMPAKQMNDYESISMAFLVLLESLTPLERAIFLMREVFDYEYVEIAEIVGKEEAACRQLFSRAKKHISEHQPRFKSSPEMHAEMMTKFMMACQAGELEGLMSLLAEDVTVYADGGGKTHAATRPIYGRDHVARYFIAIVPRMPKDATFQIAEVNGKRAIIMRSEGKVFNVMSFEVDNGLIKAIHAIMNPEKLGHL
jgi:RNA polymerase sigma-70 factor, ECF subfamily